MRLVALPAFTDNYIWMMHDQARALVVDPGDAAPVHQALDALHLELAAILVTHHHADHVGGVDDLRSRLVGPVWGPAREAIPAPFKPLRDGDRLEAVGMTFDVLDVPGHTAGHIAYLQRPSGGEAPILFCGDTLFSAGCGRLLGGTAPELHSSLQRLAALPGATRVCCTHEYTLSNLRFAAAAEPDNDDIGRHIAWCQAERAAGRPTLPSTIELERRINPFLRTDRATVIRHAVAQGAPTEDPLSVFVTLREWKNRFR